MPHTPITDPDLPPEYYDEMTDCVEVDINIYKEKGERKWTLNK